MACDQFIESHKYAGCYEREGENRRNSVGWKFSGLSLEIVTVNAFGCRSGFPLTRGAV